MLSRNALSHLYDENTSRKIYKEIKKQYIELLEALIEKLKKQNKIIKAIHFVHNINNKYKWIVFIAFCKKYSVQKAKFRQNFNKQLKKIAEKHFLEGHFPLTKKTLKYKIKTSKSCII